MGSSVPWLRAPTTARCFGNDQLTQASIADWKASAEDRQRRLRAAAQLRFDHAREINDVARSMPHFIDWMLQRHLPWMPVSIERIAAERAIVERIFGMKEVIAHACMTTQPLIIDAPSEVFVRDRHTITGTNFGAAPGTVAIRFGSSAATSLALTVVTWSDVAVIVDVPAVAPAGLPLHASASLVLTRGDVACSDTVSIVYQTPASLFVASSSLAASGINVGGGHSADHVFTSPQMPPRAEPFTYLGDDAVLSWSSTQFATGGDDPPTVSISSGPATTAANQRTVTVHVSDDWAWNYALTVRFKIRQPDDEAVGAGWAAI
jgi:hypothetical protein